MRIPNHSTTDSLVRHLQRLTADQASMQGQVSSGQRIEVASDDPVAANRTLSAQAEKQRIQQWTRNGERAMAVSSASFSAVRALKSISDRSGELAVLGTGTTSPDAYNAYAAEADVLLEQALQAANSQFAGAHLFGGTATSAPPFTATRNAAGKITAVSYAGAAQAAEFRISEGAQISPQTDGATNQGFADFMNNLVALRDGLSTQSSSAVQAAHGSLKTSEDDLLVTLSDIGAQQTRIEASAALNEARFSELEKLVSREADVDIAQTVVKLTQSQTAYQAALQSGAQLLHTSLLEYLR